VQQHLGYSDVFFIFCSDVFSFYSDVFNRICVWQYPDSFKELRIKLRVAVSRANLGNVAGSNITLEILMWQINIRLGSTVASSNRSLEDNVADRAGMWQVVT
jgi:hypothetical protein